MSPPTVETGADVGNGPDWSETGSRELWHAPFFTSVVIGKTMARWAETLAEYCVRTYGYLGAVAMDQPPPRAAKPPP